MTTADTFLVCWCLLTSSLWSVYASPSSMNSCKPYDFSGPSDVVFLIDRSESVNSKRFATYKKFISSLVTKAMKIGPDDVTRNETYSHMGVITFVAEAFIDLDLIADSRNVYSCELFADGGLFDTQVLYKERQKDPTYEGPQAALKKAPELLLQRPHIARKLLFIVSDFERITYETKNELQKLSIQLQNHTFKVFGVGGGTHFNLTTMLDLFDSDNCAARSQDDWETYVEDLPLVNGDSSGPHQVTSRDLCCSLCGESSCRCKDISSSFFYPNGSICQQSLRTCVNTKSPEVGIRDPVIPEYAWTLLLAIMVFMGGVVLATAIMAGVTKWRRKNTRPRADAVEPLEPRAAGRSPLAPEPSIHLHLNIGSLSELRRPSPGPVRLPITGRSTQTMASEFGAAAPEQPRAGGQSPRGPESPTLPQGNTIWYRRQQHPSPPPVRPTARVSFLPDDPSPLPPQPPPRYLPLIGDPDPTSSHVIVQLLTTLLRKLDIIGNREQLRRCNLTQDVNRDLDGVNGDTRHRHI